jgi:hypothetical protein
MMSFRDVFAMGYEIALDGHVAVAADWFADHGFAEIADVLTNGFDYYSFPDSQMRHNYLFLTSCSQKDGGGIACCFSSFNGVYEHVFSEFSGSGIHNYGRYVDPEFVCDPYDIANFTFDESRYADYQYIFAVSRHGAAGPGVGVGAGAGGCGVPAGRGDVCGPG